MDHLHTPSPPSPRRAVADRMTEEAERLLDSLDSDQRTVAQWEFPADEERRQWFYTPTDHGGLPLGQMSAPQQRLAFRLMASGMSTAGYVTASTIIGLENVLDQLEGFTASWNRPRGRDPLMYFVRVFGEPSSGSWSWRIGGHHISLNFTIVGGAIAGTTPLFLGADPASSPLLGPHPLRPLEGVEDLARELTRSLDPAQHARAVLTPRAPTDLVLVNRPVINNGDEPLPLRDIWRGRLPDEFDQLAIRIQAAADRSAALTIEDLAAMSFTTTPKGLPASAMNPAQRDMLDTLLRRYTGRLPDGLADEETAKFSGSGLDDVHLMWAGGLEPGEAHYYRLHSPVLLAEYDNTARGANHVHTVWRDPRGDFGGDILAAHRATHDH
jgi:Protein of unknown function (DUF3500)